jgi:hypothetical protein
MNELTSATGVPKPTILYYKGTDGTCERGTRTMARLMRHVPVVASTACILRAKLTGTTMVFKKNRLCVNVTQHRMGSRSRFQANP